MEKAKIFIETQEVGDRSDSKVSPRRTSEPLITTPVGPAVFLFMRLKDFSMSRGVAKCAGRTTGSIFGTLDTPYSANVHNITSWRVSPSLSRLLTFMHPVLIQSSYTGCHLLLFLHHKLSVLVGLHVLHQGSLSHDAQVYNQSGYNQFW